jgi:hypothetical protein
LELLDFADGLRRHAVGFAKALMGRVPTGFDGCTASGTPNVGWSFRVSSMDHCCFGDQVKDTVVQIRLSDRMHGVFR